MSTDHLARLVRGGTDVPLVSASPPPPASAAPSPRPSFWQRRVLGPIRAQLTQGVTPDKIALTLGVGTVCSVFPFLGFTTVLNLGAGIAVRLNQPILQTVNVLLGPVQLALILVFVRIGETIWREPESRFTVSEMLRGFREASFGGFLERFGWAGIHALTAWLVTAPLLIALVFFVTRPALRRTAKTFNR